MKEAVFLVQGSSAEPYKIVFQNNESVLSATCSCQAGAMGQVCKHRVSILEGSASDVVSGNEAEIATVISWLPGSKLALAMSALSEAEADLDKAKNVWHLPKNSLRPLCTPNPAVQRTPCRRS